MKLYTYNNLTTGRKQETMHADNKDELTKIMNELGYQIEITDVFDPDAFLQSTATVPTSGEPPLPSDNTNIPPTTVQHNTPQPITYFETNGIKFKIDNGQVYKKDWVEVTNKSDYKVIRGMKGKNGSIRNQNITADIQLYRHDWVEVDKQNEE